MHTCFALCTIISVFVNDYLSLVSDELGGISQAPPVAAAAASAIIEPPVPATRTVITSERRTYSADRDDNTPPVVEERTTTITYDEHDIPISKHVVDRLIEQPMSDDAYKAPSLSPEVEPEDEEEADDERRSSSSVLRSSESPEMSRHVETHREVHETDDGVIETTTTTVETTTRRQIVEQADDEEEEHDTDEWQQHDQTETDHRLKQGEHVCTTSNGYTASSFRFANKYRFRFVVITLSFPGACKYAKIAQSFNNDYYANFAIFLPDIRFFAPTHWHFFSFSAIAILFFLSLTQLSECGGGDSARVCVCVYVHISSLSGEIVACYL